MWVVRRHVVATGAQGPGRQVVINYRHSKCKALGWVLVVGNPMLIAQ